MKRTLFALIACMALGTAAVPALAEDEKDSGAAATTESTDTMATPSPESAGEAKEATAPAMEADSK